ncbi:MAG: hypothetical protein HQK77_10505, partial [Desulfobacterales bacterium]|nr:hypothetical protein [Desulfobacterales bacterium]
SSQNLSGKIDDIRIYNRVLSESEIQELYNIGNNLPPDTHCYTQDDLDAVKQQCKNDPASCGISIYSGYTQADIDSAKQQAIQQCKSDPASCGISVGIGTEGPVATLSESLFIDIPLIKYSTLLASFDLWADFEYYGLTPDGLHLWKLTDFGVIGE